MPTLFRFLFVVGTVCALVFGVLMGLVTFVEPQSRDMSINIPAEKLQRR